MKESKLHEDLASIRSMMERSSRFISLSGMSGVMAGIYALVGAGLAYSILYQPYGIFGYRDYELSGHLVDPHNIPDLLFTPVIAQLLFIAFAVLTASLVTGYALTSRKAKRQGQALWGKTSRALVFQMATPLLTGGMLIMILLSRGYFGVVSPACLVFYGLALVSASSYTYHDVKYLGICEIALGITAAALPGYGLFFWGMGFGVLHIFYGTLMYFKYDR